MILGGNHTNAKDPFIESAPRVLLTDSTCFRYYELRAIFHNITGMKRD